MTTWPQDAVVDGATVGGARRPLVGICARTAPVELQESGMLVSLVLQAHVDMVVAAGAATVLVPLLPGSAELLDGVDAVLVPGGADLDPASYGAPSHPSVRGANRGVDDVELALLSRAVTGGQPVLAVCRGMQALNVSLGGTLHTHLPDAIGSDAHRQGTGPVAGPTKLVTRPGSRLAAVFGPEVETAECRHHQAVDVVGGGLVVTAQADDGVVEAVEVEDHPFAVGVQWEAGTNPDARLHEALVDAARRQIEAGVLPGPFNRRLPAP